MAEAVRLKEQLEEMLRRIKHKAGGENPPNE